MYKNNIYILIFFFFFFFFFVDLFNKKVRNIWELLNNYYKIIVSSFILFYFKLLNSLFLDIFLKLKFHEKVRRIV